MQVKTFSLLWDTIWTFEIKLFGEDLGRFFFFVVVPPPPPLNSSTIQPWWRFTSSTLRWLLVPALSGMKVNWFEFTLWRALPFHPVIFFCRYLFFFLHLIFLFNQIWTQPLRDPTQKGRAVLHMQIVEWSLQLRGMQTEDQPPPRNLTSRLNLSLEHRRHLFTGRNKVNRKDFWGVVFCPPSELGHVFRLNIIIDLNQVLFCQWTRCF